jgi:hypothetical protein
VTSLTRAAIIEKVCSRTGHTKTAKAAKTKPFKGAHHVNKPANDNPVQAGDFPDTPEGLAARRA